MKTITIVIFFFISIPVFSQTYPDSLKQVLIDFLLSINDVSEDAKNTMLIVNDLVTYKEFKNQDYGIFRFCTLSTHVFTHILLVSKGKYIIVNMYEPLEKSLYSVLEYLKLDKNYSKEDTVKYVEGVLKLHKINSEVIPWKI